MSIAVYITQLFQRNIRISLENEKLKNIYENKERKKRTQIYTVLHWKNIPSKHIPE